MAKSGSKADVYRASNLAHDAMGLDEGLDSLVALRGQTGVRMIASSLCSVADTGSDAL